jgi:hypothetical protein
MVSTSRKHHPTIPEGTLDTSTTNGVTLFPFDMSGVSAVTAIGPETAVTFVPAVGDPEASETTSTRQFVVGFAWFAWISGFSAVAENSAAYSRQLTSIVGSTEGGAGKVTVHGCGDVK